MADEKKTKIEHFNDAVRSWNESRETLNFLVKTSEYGGGRVALQASVSALAEIVFTQQKTQLALIDTLREVLTDGS